MKRFYILKVGAFFMFLRRVYYGILYFLDLIYEIIKATCDVSKRVFNKDIDPVVIDIHTELERTVSQTILANSISLTPGTLSVDLDPESQIIKVAIIAPRDVKDVIPFEPYIKEMLE